MMKKVLFAAGLMLAASTITYVQPASSQQQPAAAIKRTPLQKADIPGTNYEAVTAMAELPANVNIGKHTHPGVENGYLLEGEVTLLVQGQPDRHNKQGDSWTLPVGVVHDAKAGASGAKVLVTYIVEKGKPLASPAP
jgi:quercetin dioxygenase-like cupin family protein